MTVAKHDYKTRQLHCSYPSLDGSLLRTLERIKAQRRGRAVAEHLFPSMVVGQGLFCGSDGGVGWGGSLPVCPSESLILQTGPVPSVAVPMGPFLPSPYHSLRPPPPPAHTHTPTSHFLSTLTKRFHFLDTGVSSSSAFHSSLYTPCNYFPPFFFMLTFVPFASFLCFPLSPFLFKFASHSKLIMPAPSSLPHPHRALSPEMHAVTSEWISLTVGVPGRRPLALTPPLPPLPETSIYNTDHLASWVRPGSSLSLSLPHSSWSDRSTPRSIASPLALPPPNKASSLAPSAPTSLHVNGDSGVHVPPPGVRQDSFSQLLPGSSDRVISELSNAFSSQGKRQPRREERGQCERRAEREAGERYPGAPKISKKSCLRPSDVVRCLSAEQRLSDLHGPEESRPGKPPGSPFPGREAEQTELHRGGEQAERRAARSAVSQVGLQHDRVCLGVSVGRVGWTSHPWPVCRGPVDAGESPSLALGPDIVLRREWRGH